jgi:RND family efflux transporter MFP subunit
MTSRLLLFSAAALLLAGCGKPPQMGGAPGDYPVNAVVALVKAETVADALRVVGQVQAAESVRLVSEVDATLIEVGVQDGDRVKKGQLLYKFDDHKFVAALAQSESRLVLAKSELERAQNLRATKTIPQQDVDRAQAEFRAADAAMVLAADNLADVVVTAPFDGVLEDRPVSLGQFCARGQDLGLLVQTDPLEITFDTPEREAGRLADRPDRRIRLGRLSRPGVQGGNHLPVPASSARKAAPCAPRPGCRTPTGKLKPGMFGAVSIILAQRPGVLRIPESAVSLHARTASVVVMDPEGKAELRPVVTGRRGDNSVEITSGLKAGEKVVVEGFQKMGPGSKILVSPKSAAYGVNPPAAPDAAPPAGAQALPKETAPAAAPEKK